jgi:hypothetical protein
VVKGVTKCETVHEKDCHTVDEEKCAWETEQKCLTHPGNERPGASFYTSALGMKLGLYVRVKFGTIEVNFVSIAPLENEFGPWG